MSDEKKQVIEKIFRDSNSPNDLFDAFRIAISNHIEDPDLYKTLLWNKALSTDEISMFVEKICKEFPEISFNIYLWAGNVFSTSSISGENYSKAFNYFKNALDINEKSSEPYLAISGFYNKELNLPPFEEIIKVLETGLDRVENKSKVCFALSDLYKNVGKKEGAQKYRSLGEQFQRKGH